MYGLLVNIFKLALNSTCWLHYGLLVVELGGKPSTAVCDVIEERGE